VLVALLVLMAPPDCRPENDAGPKALVELLEQEYRSGRRVRQVLLEHVDFDDIARESLDGQWATLTGKQQRRFTRRFRDLLVTRAITAAHSTDYDLTIEGVTWAPPFVGVKTRLRVGVRAPAILVVNLRYDGERCRVVDVVVEDRSVVRDYREQFGRILSQRGWADLMRRMSDRTEAMKRK